MGHISRGTLNTGLAIAVGLVVLFFAATRTQVGRDGFARQLESRFSAETGAQLSIGQMTGNVLNELYATDVHLYSPYGSLLVQVDSIVVEPRWSALLKRDFSLHRITLYRPHLNWPADSVTVFLPSSSPLPADSIAAQSRSPWQFRNAALRVVDGSVSIPHADISDSSFVRFGGIEGLNLDAVVDWSEDDGQIDILSFQVSMPESRMNVEEAAAQIFVRQGQWTLNQGFIRTSDSEIRMRGYTEFPIAGEWDAHPFQFELEPSFLDLNEWKGLFPGIPFEGRPQVALHVDGPANALNMGWFRVSTGESFLEASGTAIGYPGSVDLEFSVSNTSLRAIDLASFLPSNRTLRNLRSDLTDVQLYAAGTLQGNDWKSLELDTRSTFEFRSTGGSISGAASLTGAPSDTLRHDITVRLEEINAYPWTSRIQWSSDLSGFLSASGQTVSMPRLTSRFNGQFQRPVWGVRRADSLAVEMDITPDSTTGVVEVLVGEGNILSRLSLIPRPGSAPTLAVDVSLEQADVGPLLGRPAVSSSINARLQASSSTVWDRSFEASLEAVVEPSSLIIDADTVYVPAHSIRGAVHSPGRELPILTVFSDMVDAQIDGDISLPTIVALSRAWISSARSVWDVENRKTLRGEFEEAFDPTVALSDLLAADAARERLPLGVPVANTSASVTLHSGELLSALSPAFPTLIGGGTLSADLLWSADSLQARLTGSSTSQLGIGSFKATAPRMQSVATVRRSGDLLSTLALASSIEADTLVAGGTEVISPRLEADIADGQGFFELASSGTVRIDSTLLTATWQHLPDRNDLRVDGLRISAGDGTWQLEEQAVFGLYGDATSLDQMLLAYYVDDLPTGQSLFAGGVLSSAPQDSLQIRMDQLLLRPLSEFFEWRRVLGGRVDGDILLRGGRTAPRVSGNTTVGSFSLDHYLLGDVTITSDFLVSRPDVAVSLNLYPLLPDDEAVLLGTNEPAVVLQNDLSVEGDLRLPDQLLAPDGSLNLDVDIDRADVFWMKYLFPEALGSVSGFLSGSGRVGGTFAYPVFDVSLGILDGHFDIPYTQTEYDVSGTLRLDREAIHFEPLRLVDTTGGEADVTGRLLFNDYSRFSFDMEGDLDELQIMNVASSEELPFYGFIWASGDIALTGPLFDARLVSTNGRTRADSELFIPIEEETSDTDQAFIVFEDSLGVIPDFDRLASRSSILQRRPTSERQFLDGLSLDLNIDAPPGSTVHLVIDPLLGDVINAVSQGNVQLILENDEFQVFGQLDVTSGDYQFTAGELFIKTFDIKPGGSIVWSGDPINATLNIPASYRTRASRAGLPGTEGERPGVIPLIVNLQIAGTVESPEVDLSLAIDRSNQNVLGEYQALETLLNQPDRATEYATSVLILNSFQLTTENITTDSGSQLAFNSVSQLVTAQLNRFLESAIPNVDFSFGLQGESAQDLDVTYGVALRLLNERLIIRGEGVYQGARSTDNVRTTDGLQGEFVVEIRVGPQVSVEVFFRRESDILETTQLTNTAGVGLSYQTEFESWRSVFRGPARTAVNPQ